MTPKTLDKYIAALKKKAAAEGWTPDHYQAELDKIKNEMAQQYLDNKITTAEYTKVSKQLDNATKNQSLLGKAQPVVQTAPQGMTHEEYIGLWKDLQKKQKAGLITADEYKALGGKLDAAYANKKTVAEIQGEIGLDPGTKATDQAILKLGKEFRQIYGQAASEMQKKLDDFMQKYGPEMKALELKFINGTIDQKELDRLKALMVRQKGFQQKIDQLSGVMLNANKKAMAAVNGSMLGVFAENANWQSYQLTQDAGMDLMFTMYDEHTTEMLIQKNPELLPRKEVNEKKDVAWNRKQISGAVTQAILQGESIDKLAARVAKETGESNEKAMMRYARTAMTAAQNSGRIEMLHRAQAMGIKVKKRWLATLDSRTRDSHQHMDGVSVGVDEDFVTPLGSKMQYPGDPNGKGGDVWNCRCTLVYDYEGFPNDPAADVRRDNESGDVIQSMPYDEWKAAKQASVLNDLSMAKHDLAEAQKEYIGKKVSETKKYEGIWKDPVTLADYPDKAGAVEAKRDYYTTEIQKYKDAQANGASWATDEKIKDLQKKLRSLNEFEKHGQILQKRNAALKKVQDLYNQAGIGQAAAAPEVAKKAKKKATKAAAPAADANAQVPQTPAQKGQFAPDAWDEKTKQAARKYSGKMTADDELRPELDETWNNLTDAEKYGVWEYTRNSHPMNQALSGYEDGWGRSRHYVGPENTYWGYQDKYGNRNLSEAPAMMKFGDSRGQPSYHKAITQLTNGIEKSKLKKGMWLVRGSDDEGLAGMMEGGGMSFSFVKSLLDGSHSIDEVRSALVGQVGRNHAFTSTGVATGTGFGGQISYRIYAPEGTKGIYAEPQSYWGGTATRKIYKKGDRRNGVSNEAEIIIQRGTAYRITGVNSRGRNNYEIVMEVVEQPDYFVYGDENTYDGGKTRQKR